MSKLILALALLCCVLQNVNGRSARVETPATTTAIPNLAEAVQNWLNSKDTQDLKAVVQSYSDQIASQVQAAIVKVNQDAANSPANQLIKSFSDNVTTQIDEWKRQNPDVVQTAEKTKENFEKSFRNIVAETQDLSVKLAAQGEHVPENIQKLAQQLNAQVLQVTQSAANQLQTIANKPQ